MDPEAALLNTMPLVGSEARSAFPPYLQMRRFLMKSLSWKLALVAGVSCLVLFGNTTPVFAAEDNPPGPDERLQRLERRINELTEQQDQMMRRLEAQREGRGPMGRRLGALADAPGPMPPPGSENIQPAPPPAGPNFPAMVRIHRLGDLVRLMALWFIVCNILLAIWIFTDSRKRGEGSGIFIAVALLAGVPAAIIYSLVRIGDKVTVTAK